MPGVARRVRARSRLLLLAPWLIATAPVSIEDEAIEIIGSASDEVRREASDYVAKLGVASGNRPAARWVDQICPQAIGLAPAQEASAEQQVRAVAQSVGAPVARNDCRPNLVLIFTDDAPAVLKTVSRKVPLALSPTERRLLETGNAPIRWWYNSEVRDRDGASMGTASPVFRILNDMGAGSVVAGQMPANDRTKQITIRSDTPAGTTVMRALTHATIVIDVKRAAGTTLSSVVDYAALVGLAEVRLDASPSNSVLGMFSGPPGLAELTATDRAFLKGLYSMHLARRAEQHRRVLAGRIIKERLDK